MRIKIKMSPSRLIGLRSPVVSSMFGSAAIKWIFRNVGLRLMNHLKASQSVFWTNYSVFDTQVTCWFGKSLPLEPCVLDSRFSSTTVDCIASVKLLGDGDLVMESSQLYYSLSRSSVALDPFRKTLERHPENVNSSQNFFIFHQRI